MGWKSLRFNPGSLYIAHTRSTTDGDPNVNANNHPHIGKHSVMVHNGMVFSFESIARTYNFDMQTECDSEVLLHLAEVDEDMKQGLRRMMMVTHGSSGMASIATAFVDRRNPTEVLLTRNSGNPLHIFECERLNCVFFVSTDAIFDKALEMLYDSKNLHQLGFKRSVVETHKLYRLKQDGTVVKEDLVSFTKAHQQAWTGSDDDTVGTKEIQEQSQHPLAYSTIFGDDFELGIDGSIVPFGAHDEHADLKTETFQNDEFELMPSDIKKELVTFLEQHKR